jgi:predicted nucleic acid-binding Zn ribbon protein
LNKKKNSDKLIHISDILKSALGKYRPAKDLDMTQIWDIWDDAVGKAIVMNAKPDSFKDGILIVNVSSSAWIHQLKFLEKDMISNINRKLDHPLDHPLVKQIRFKIGKILS